MEQYLTPEKILYYPFGKKYKKTTYGGAKVFMKRSFINTQDQIVSLEFVLHMGHWRIDKEEHQRANKLKINPFMIKKTIKKLNKKHLNENIKLKLTKKEYQKLYSNYPDADKLGYYNPNSPEYIRVIDVLKNIQDKSVVYDAGCNSGGIGKLLISQKGCQVYGSEISPVLAQKAEKKGLTVINGWAEKTPFKSRFFDYAILTFILEHVLNPEKVMAETLRLLKPSGKILGHVPTEFGDWGQKTIGKHREHLRAYSKQELQNLLKRFKLNSIVIEKEKLVGRKVADYYFFTAIK